MEDCMQPAAKILLDSISPEGQRVTTMEVTFHRFVLAEFNTHRVFSRNSASSRAIPVEKQLKRFREHPAVPVSWPAEQPGMQGGTELEDDDLIDAYELLDSWHEMTEELIGEYIDDHPDKSRRLHKSVLNRLMEPMQWHTVIVTATEWDGFFHQRVSELAQPEINAVAVLMQDAMRDSTPTPLAYGEWHCPLIQPDEKDLTWDVKKELSTARCARVSYLTHEGIRDMADDLRLFLRLCEADPMHASPPEHVCTPKPPSEKQYGNLRGFSQFRHALERDLNSSLYMEPIT
jgi:hypothetical protein